MRRPRNSLLIAPGILLLGYPVFAQTPNKFEFADVHTSPKAGLNNQFMRVTPPSAGRYDIHNATMVNLVALAYSVAQDKVLGGPAWLESDRFEISARVPANLSQDSLHLMLQSLLADRFGLVVHNENKPLPSYALVAGKNPKLKEADGEGDSGCKAQDQPNSGGANASRIFLGNGVAFTLGDDRTILYRCRNITMDEFVGRAGLRGMVSNGALNANIIPNETGLKGSWNFELRYTLGLGPVLPEGVSQITIFDAVDKQLGLKLEPRPVSTPVIVVDKVNEKPAENPPGTAEALPPKPVATEFEIADVKLVDSAVPVGGIISLGMQPGGRYVAKNAPLSLLVNQALNIQTGEQITAMPAWASGIRVEIAAKAGDPDVGQESAAPMLLSLLKERFGLKTHSETKTITAYTLTAAKPKMKKANPENRTGCNSATPPPGTPSTMPLYFVCQNITMAQFADQLQFISRGALSWPVTDTTGISGAWDFTLNFSPAYMAQMVAGGRAGAGGAGSENSASDPVATVTLFEALEKQLGLKLEPEKREEQVIVIDHLEQKPTEN